MNIKNIEFVVCIGDKQEMEECMSYLKKLNTP